MPWLESTIFTIVLLYALACWRIAVIAKKTGLDCSTLYAYALLLTPFLVLIILNITKEESLYIKLPTSKAEEFQLLRELKESGEITKEQFEEYKAALSVHKQKEDL